MKKSYQILEHLDQVLSKLNPQKVLLLQLSRYDDPFLNQICGNISERNIDYEGYTLGSPNDEQQFARKKGEYDTVIYVNGCGIASQSGISGKRISELISLLGVAEDRVAVGINNPEDGSIARERNILFKL